jgi:hypothetical protein
MIRWTDLIGICGFGVVIYSFILLFGDSENLSSLAHWLGAIALWLFGFASVIGWVLLRWSVQYSKNGPGPLLIWSLRPRHQDSRRHPTMAKHLDRTH